jgi:hypothetical protein
VLWKYPVPQINSQADLFKLFNVEEQRKLVQTYRVYFCMKITNLKFVKADSIATVELSQVRVEMQLPKSQNDIVQTTDKMREARQAQRSKRAKYTHIAQI